MPGHETGTQNQENGSSALSTKTHITSSTSSPLALSHHPHHYSDHYHHHHHHHYHKADQRAKISTSRLGLDTDLVQTSLSSICSSSWLSSHIPNSLIVPQKKKKTFPTFFLQQISQFRKLQFLTRW